MINIKQKIIITVVLMTLLATVTAGGISVIYTLGRIKENTNEYLSENAKSYGHELDGVIIGLEVTVDALLKTTYGLIDKDRLDDPNYYYELSNTLENVLDNFDENSINAMSMYIRFDPKISYSTAGVFHADTNGDGVMEHLEPTDLSLYAPEDREHVGWFYEPINAGKAIWMDPYYNANVDVDMVSYIAPLYVDGKAVGVVGADINFAQLSDITKKRLQVGKVVLIDHNNNFLVHDVYSMKDSLLTIDDGNLKSLAQELEENDFGVISYNLNDEKKILGYSHLKNGWTVLVALTEQEAFTKLNRIMLILMSINTSITVVMLIIAGFIGRYLNSLVLRNSELELMVDERTTQLIETNEYLEVSMSELENSQAELTMLNDQLETSLMQIKEMQDKIIVSEKLASLGELISGVAHELNTPLGIGITMNSFLLKKFKHIEEKISKGQLNKTDLDDCVENAIDSLEIIGKTFTRLSDLVESFKQITMDKNMIDIRKLNFSKFLNDIAFEANSALHEHDHILTVVCDENLEAITYPSVVKYIVNQLILNSIIHGFAEMESGQITVQVAKNNGVIELLYKDNGRGISSEFIKRIFDPFFTTRKNKGSAGLGLHITYNLVTQTLGGELEVESHGGEGVIYKIRFEELKIEDNLNTDG